METASTAPVTEDSIKRLVHTFYGRVRSDELIGPIFNSQIEDWDDHLAKLCDFWSSMILRTGRYQGRPMRPHLMLPLEGQHFDRWLDLFEATAREVFHEDIAAVFIDRARRIADSFEMGVKGQQGVFYTPRHVNRPL